MQNEIIILTKQIHKNIDYKATLPIVRSTYLRAEIYKVFSLPTVFVCPFSAAIIKGVFPEESTAFTWALWLSRSCRHSTWSVKAAAWRGVLQQIKRQYGHAQPRFLFYSKGHADRDPGDTNDCALPLTDPLKSVLLELWLLPLESHFQVSNVSLCVMCNRDTT